MSPAPYAVPKTSAEVQIKYNHVDITARCSIADSTFTTRASGSPGQAKVVFKDTRQRFNFVAGKQLELFIDGERQWDGYGMQVGYNYWFETHTANCEPCPHVTPRKLILYGADRNILFKKRWMFNKADPVGEPYPPKIYWPANTPDNEVIEQFIDDYIVDVDGVDYTTKVEHVGSPDPYEEFRVPAVGNPLLSLLTQIAESTGAIFYIDPDRYLIYTDVDTPDAPWVLMDRPSSGNEIGFQSVEILSDGNRLINDAMIWGAGQGSPNITFHREEDAASIDAHGRWQNTGGFRSNVWRQATAQRIAESILYGSPTNKRGHKDPVVSVHCRTFHHGFRVAQKVIVDSIVFDFVDVIPIREMTISFVNPTQPIYDLILSHDIDEPWTTQEFWWPDEPDDEQPIDDPPPQIVCTTTKPIDTLVATSSSNPDPDIPVGIRLGDVEVQINDIDWSVSIEADGYPPNKQTWYQTLDGIRYGSADVLGSAPAMAYRQMFEDKYWYNTGDGALQNPGGTVYIWQNAYMGLNAPANLTYPEEGVYAHITGTIDFSGTEADRDVYGHLFPFPGLTRENISAVITPHLVSFGLVTPPDGYYDIDGVWHVQVIPPPRSPGMVFWEGYVFPQLDIPVNLSVWMPSRGRKYLSIEVKEVNLNKPWATVQIESSLTVTWTEAHTTTIGIPPDADGIPCYEVGFGGTGNVHHVATLLYGTTYRVPYPYVPGTTRVYVDGIHWHDYEESSPTLGQIRLGSAVEGEVAVAYVSAVSNVAMLEADGYFIIPVSGPITGTFGAQTAGWPPAYWHGTYYENFHNGVDYGVPVGTPVYASADGSVRHETQDAGGVMIHIYHDNGLRSVYAHLSQRLVDDGVEVSQGDIIGYSGATGTVTGAHLHWGCVFQGSPEDPLGFT